MAQQAESVMTRVPHADRAQRVAATGGAAGAVQFLLAGAGRRGRRLCQVRRLLPGKLPAAPAGRPGRAYPRGQLRPRLSGQPAARGRLHQRASASIPIRRRSPTPRRRQLPCETAHAFAFLEQNHEPFDVIVPEQELNHLTLDEQLEFLSLCLRNLKPGGLMIVYGLNGANPLVGSENLAHNIDHFNTFTDYSLNQILQLAGFTDIKVMPLKLYVFWKNPLNYVGLAGHELARAVLSCLLRSLRQGREGAHQEAGGGLRGPALSARSCIATCAALEGDGVRSRRGRRRHVRGRRRSRRRPARAAHGADRAGGLLPARPRRTRSRWCMAGSATCSMPTSRGCAIRPARARRSCAVRRISCGRCRSWCRPMAPG